MNAELPEWLKSTPFPSRFRAHRRFDGLAIDISGMVEYATPHRR
jgi:hypothetical protein